MPKGKEIHVRFLDSVELDRAETEEGPDNLWVMTLKSDGDQRVYLLNSDSLRHLAEEIFKRIAS